MLKRLLVPRFNLPFSLSCLVSQCAVCHSWPAQQVCAPCVSRFSPQTLRCTACALDLPPDLSLDTAGVGTSPRLCIDCIRHPPPVDSTLVAVSYAYPWSELITRYKFGNRPGWAPFLTDILLNAPGVRPVLEALHANDLIIPIPLSAERLQSRGFNQAWALARGSAGWHTRTTGCTLAAAGQGHPAPNHLAARSQAGQSQGRFSDRAFARFKAGRAAGGSGR